MEKKLNVRIPQKIDTTSNWENSTLVLKKGEIGIEETIDGTKKFKWGDGVNTWKNLPYATGEALNHILDGIANGSVRTSGAAAEGADYKLGNAAFAEGQGTKASGNFSHAEGYNTVASSAYTHAEGRQTTASGSVAHAEGTGTVASGARSHAGGYGTIAKGENQTAIGKYNIEDSNNEFAFIVGNGSSTARANAFTVDWNGNAAAGGKKLATEEYAAANGGKIDAVKVNGQNLTITDKSVNIEVPTKVSELSNDSNFLTQSQGVRYDAAQTLTAAQKTQVRTNIGAGTSNFDGNYNSLSNKPTIPSKTSQLTNDSGFAEASTTLAGYGIGDAYTKTQTDSQITTKIQGLKKADAAVSGKYVSAVSEENGVITVTRADLPAAPEQTDYTVTVTESTPEGYAKAYTIKQTASGLNTTINIPKDMVVESGRVETKTTSGAWGLAGTYLVLTLANATSDTIYINVGTLIEYVTSGSGANDAIQIAVDATTHKITASIKDGSIAKGKLDSTVQASLTKADNAPTAETVDSAIGTYAKNVLNYTDKAVSGQYVSAIDQANGIIKVTRANLPAAPDLSVYAKKDLTNIDNTVFKNKVTASGFTSGTKVELYKWGPTD